MQNQFVYDVLGRKVQQTDPDSGVTTFEYNVLGELLAQQDSQGNRIENELDARGRVWRKTVKRADGSTESQSTYDFDTAINGLGQLASEAITGVYSASNPARKSRPSPCGHSLPSSRCRPKACWRAIRRPASRPSGPCARADFWWFALAVAMLLTFAQLLAESFGPLPLQLASLLVLLPWIAACTRRLRDAGFFNPWWQLISLAPVGGLIVLLYLLTYPSKAAAPVEAGAGEAH